MIKSLLNNKTDESAISREKPLSSPRIEVPKLENFRSNKSAGSNRLSQNKSGGLIEDKVERALLDLNEYKNNFMVEKIGYE